jgi:hypothetical protein
MRTGRLTPLSPAFSSVCLHCSPLGSLPFYAKKAAEHTESGAIAAQLGQRPWLDFGIKLHGVAVSYTGTGYDFQLEIKVRNTGNNPANFVRSETDAYLPNDRPSTDIDNVFSRRELRLRELPDEVAARLLKAPKNGATIFPNEDYTIYAEPTLPWNFSEGFPCDFGWLIVGLRYGFKGGEGQTIKVFRVRSFGFTTVRGFKGLGTTPFEHADTEANIDEWTYEGRAE